MVSGRLLSGSTHTGSEKKPDWGVGLEPFGGEDMLGTTGAGEGSNAVVGRAWQKCSWRQIVRGSFELFTIRTLLPTASVMCG